MSAGGFVYAAAIDGTAFVKIGSARDVERRFAQLQVNTPYTLVLLHQEWFAHPRRVESAIHQLLDGVRYRGEWFELPRSDLPGLFTKAARAVEHGVLPAYHLTTQPPRPPSAPLALLARFFPALPHMVGRVAPSSLQQYLYAVQHYLAFCTWKADQVYDAATLRAWRTHMVEREGLAAATINARLTAVKTLMRCAVEQGACDVGVAYSLIMVESVRERTLRERQRQAVRVYPDEIRRLWRTPDPTTLKGVRDRALLATLATSGCRISEVVALRQSQIFWDGSKGTIAVLGKNQVKPRRAPLSVEAYTWIASWLERRLAVGIDVELIFTSVTGRGHYPTPKPLDRHGAYRIVKDAAKKAGLPALSPHDFRRFVGSELAKRHQLQVVQQALGHQRPDTTAGYILDMPDMEGITEGFF